MPFLKSVILRLFLPSTRHGQWLSWKNQHWQNERHITSTTLPFLLLRKITLIFLLLIAPAAVITTIQAVVMVAAVPVITVVDGTVVE
ncbi:hypothetical protein A2U01_0060851, partial [Trifolium medium]|nr:hypothetical protein [Trifolium medium]